MFELTLLLYHFSDIQSMFFEKQINLCVCIVNDKQGANVVCSLPGDKLFFYLYIGDSTLISGQCRVYNRKSIVICRYRAY